MIETTCVRTRSRTNDGRREEKWSAEWPKRLRSRAGEMKMRSNSDSNGLNKLKPKYFKQFIIIAGAWFFLYLSLSRFSHWLWLFSFYFCFDKIRCCFIVSSNRSALCGKKWQFYVFEKERTSVSAKRRIKHEEIVVYKHWHNFTAGWLIETFRSKMNDSDRDKRP